MADRSKWDFKEANGQTLRERMQHVGKPGFDVERLINSEQGDRILEIAAYQQDFTGEDDPALYKYWEERGIKKTIHNADNYEEKWASYLPLAALKDDGRRYPAIFVLHGGVAPIYKAETYGFVQQAGEKEYILVMPQDTQNVEHLAKLFREIIDKLPIDRSRVYCTGYSAGGGACNNFALSYPEFFAAAAPCGVHVCPDEYMLPEEHDAHFIETELPMINIVGEHEGTLVLPWNEDDLAEGSEFERSMKVEMARRERENVPLRAKSKGGKPSTAEAKIRLLNRRLRLIGHAEIPLADCVAVKDGDNITNIKIGCPFDRTETRVIFGKQHYIGDFFGKGGKLRFRAVAVEDMPHFMTDSACRLAMEFFEKFSRDPQTGKIVEK